MVVGPAPPNDDKGVDRLLVSIQHEHRAVPVRDLTLIKAMPRWGGSMTSSHTMITSPTIPSGRRNVPK
jgi:hypothetical protein